jgi:oligoendopeptidase F
MKRYRKILFITAIVFFLPHLSFSLTVEEVIKLKKAGVSDETIQLMIQQEMQREELSDPYKNIGVRKIKKPDGKSSTIYSTGEIEDRRDYDEESEREKREKAWEMLNNIIIDTRDSAKDSNKKDKKKEK